jgi:dethiobiotin synthetase
LSGVFVTGTDTGVGKTYVAAALARALRDQGRRVGVFKPLVTGLDDGPPYDHELLAQAAGVDAAAVAVRTYGPPVSPHLAQELAGEALDFDALVAAGRAAADAAEVLVAEGVGGLLVPLTAERSVRDLCVALGLPLVVVARPALGTINHTLLTLEAARAAGLEVRGVVMTPWRDGTMERSNAQTVERLGGVPVVALAPGAAAPDQLVRLAI